MEPAPSFQEYVDAIVPNGDKYGAWRYDVKAAAKTVVIFMLDPESIVPVVTKSMCLQYLVRPGDSRNAVLHPKVTSGGVEVSTSFVTNVIGSSVVKSADDVRQILDFLDAGDKQDSPEHLAEQSEDVWREGLRDYLIVSPPSPEIALPISFTSAGTNNDGHQSIQATARKCQLAASNLCGMVAHMCPDRPKPNLTIKKDSSRSPLDIPRTPNFPIPRPVRTPKAVSQVASSPKSGVCPLEASKLCGLIPHACPKKAQPVLSSQARNLLMPSRSYAPSAGRVSQLDVSTAVGKNAVANQTCPLAASKLCGIVAHKCPDAKKPSASTPVLSSNDPIARLSAVINAPSKAFSEQFPVVKRKLVAAEDNSILKKSKTQHTPSTPVQAKKVVVKAKRGSKTTKPRRSDDDDEGEVSEDPDFVTRPLATATPRRSSARLAVRASQTPQTNVSEDENSSAVESNPDDTDDDANFEPDNDDDRVTSDDETQKAAQNSETEASQFIGDHSNKLLQKLHQTSRDNIDLLLQSHPLNSTNHEHNFMPAANPQNSEPTSGKNHEATGNNTETVSEGGFESKTAAELLNKGTTLVTTSSVMKGQPHSGGTIISSQYWTTPGPDKVKLQATQAVYVDKEAMKALTEEYSKNDTGKKLLQMSRCIKCGWTLIEHLLGGTESIARSLSACSDSTSSFNTETTSNIVNTVCQAVTEHVRAVFFSRNVERFDKKLFQTEIRRRLFHSASYSTRASWRPCAPQVREALRINGNPGPGKVQLTYGFDYYISAEKLAGLKRRYFEDYEGADDMETIATRYANDVTEALLGDLQKLKENAMAKVGGAIGVGKLAGDSVQHAIYSHTKDLFRLSDNFDIAVYKKRTTRSIKWRTENINTALLASVVFSEKAESDARYDNGSPVQPGCNYWNAPAPNLTRLSERHNIFMKTLHLAEYQRYYGPESMRQGQFMRYIIIVAMHALGGEPAVYKKIADMLTDKPAYGEIVPKELLEAICVHVQSLFKPQKVSTYALQSKVVDKLRLIGRNIQKGVSHHAYSVREYPEKPPEIIQLDQARYWTQPAPDRTQIRLGRDIYVEKSFLSSLQDLCGPSSTGKSINKYGYLLAMHLVGGEDTMEFCRQNKKMFPEALKSMVELDVLIAVCLHAEETFHLTEALNPLFLCSDATTRLAERRRGPRTDRREKFLAKQVAKVAKKKEIENLRKMTAV